MISLKLKRSVGANEHTKLFVNSRHIFQNNSTCTKNEIKRKYIVAFACVDREERAASILAERAKRFFGRVQHHYSGR